MADPFEKYDSVRAERKPLTKMIEGEEFEFPGAAPATVALDFLNLAVSNPEANAVDIALTLLPRVMEDEARLQKLFELTSYQEVRALVEGLFQHYGLIQDGDEPAPNRRARRASRPRSSKGSARSEQTSATTTT